MTTKKKVLYIVFFLIVMLLTFITIFKEINILEMMSVIEKMNIWYLVSAMLFGLLFVSIEGIMFFYLLSSMKNSVKMKRCIQYSFIGFFYSGITPSATGGQPMQLYYMKKDGLKTADSAVTLMAVAFMYKFVLVLIGISMALFWSKGLQRHFGAYYHLYILGLFLNTALVVFIGGVMLYPSFIHRAGKCIINCLSGISIIKKPMKHIDKLDAFINSYKQTVCFMTGHRKILVNLLVASFVQRITVFSVTYLVYKGFGLSGTNIFCIMALQAAVYIAVDMLPIPGSQGITEIVYKAAFSTVFLPGLLMPSMLVSRSVSFYFLLVISMVVCMNFMMYRESEKF